MVTEQDENAIFIEDDIIKFEYTEEDGYELDRIKNKINKYTSDSDELSKALVSESDKRAKKLNALRNSLPDKFQVVDSFGNRIGNIAYSTSEIKGYSIDEFKSFSKYGSRGKNGVKNAMEGWVSSVDNPRYSNDVLKINSDNEIDMINGYLRNNDTEYKIIEQYNHILNEDYYAEGKIIIVSEREICPSCDNVIKSFSRDYSNIEITLIDGTGKSYIVKNGLVQ